MTDLRLVGLVVYVDERELLSEDIRPFEFNVLYECRETCENIVCVRDTTAVDSTFHHPPSYLARALCMCARVCVATNYALLV